MMFIFFTRFSWHTLLAIDSIIAGKLFNFVYKEEEESRNSLFRVNLLFIWVPGALYTLSSCRYAQKILTFVLQYLNFHVKPEGRQCVLQPVI
jgi:hypothetical protein